MARPSVLTYLSPGKLIDTFKGFVDTWNYIVDFIENLRGDGDDDSEKSITVDRSVPDHPVIKCSASGGGGSVEVDEVSVTKHETGYSGKIAVKGHASATQDQVFSKGASAPTWAYPTIAAQGTTGAAQRGQTIKIASGYATNIAATASKSGDVVTLTLRVMYV